MNRFDGIIEFSALSKENLLTIMDLMLDNVNQRLANNGIHLSVTDKLRRNWLTLVTILRWGLDHYVVPSRTILKMLLLTSTLKIQMKKDLKAVMTSKGHITIKSAKKAEKTAQKAETAKETD